MAMRTLLTVALLVLLGGTPAGQTQEMRFFRIGTGGVAAERHG